MGSKIEKFGEDFFRPVNKAVKSSGLAGILPYASMALPFLGLPGGAFTRYLLPQLMTSASSVAEGGKLNPLRNLTTLGASYLAGPTANRPGGADPFKLRDEPKIFMGGKTNQLPPGAFGGKNPTTFQKFKTSIGDLGEQAKNYVQSGNITGIPDADTLAQFTQPAKTVGTLVGADRSLNAYEAAKQAEKDYKNSGSDDGYNSAEYTSYLKKYLANAGYSQEEIDDYMANRPSYNMGGRVGLAFGGDPTSQSIIDMLIQESIEEQIPPKGFMSMGGPRLPMDIDDLESDDLEIMDEFEEDQGRTFAGGPKSLLDPKEMQVASGYGGYLGDEQDRADYEDGEYDKLMTFENYLTMLAELQQESKNESFYKKGGIASLKMGGMPSMEMDYRGGGFIPVGSKEKADDVPARLSKNEFVMTADAVRAAGGGSVNKGAQKMYQLMNELEAKV